MTSRLAQTRQDKKLKKAGVDYLDDFFQNACGVSLVELDAIITAVISGPLPLMPSDWMPFIGIYDSHFDSDEEARRICNDILVFYAMTDDELEQGIHRPLLAIKKNNPSAAEIYNANAIWANAYLRVVEWHYDDWMPQDQMERTQIVALLTPIISFSGPQEELAKKLKANNDGITLEAAQQSVVDSLPHCIDRVYRFWAERRGADVIPNPAQHQQHSDKVQRNDPCPCGSGKKYKKCCLQ